MCEFGGAGLDEARAGSTSTMIWSLLALSSRSARVCPLASCKVSNWRWPGCKSASHLDRIIRFVNGADVRLMNTLALLFSSNSQRVAVTGAGCSLKATSKAA